MADRFDVVLFGPTGVTGREVARYLHGRAPEVGRSWAVAGRDPGRVREALDRVGAEPDGVLEADAADRASIDAMAASAAVVANLVGPYARFGEPVHAACAAAGTHQLDLAGEMDWVADMIVRYDGTARSSGARIVPTAGFEALPFDLATLLAATTAHERSGEPVATVDVALDLVRGGSVRRLADAVSGGTFTSGLGMLERGGGRLDDAHLLDPPGHRRASGRTDLRPRRHPATGAWLGPPVPSPFIVPPVVHRSAALHRDAGGAVFAPSFRYREGAVVDRLGLAAPLAAAAATGAQAGLALLVRAPSPLRRAVAQALRRVGPGAGEGPAAEDLDAWSYRLDVRATTTGGHVSDVVVEADGHPGYKSTATMVGEAALVLADADAPVPAGAGYRTPATALGLDVLDRFRRAGLRMEVC